MQAQGAAGLDGRELPVVAEQPDPGAVLAGQGEDPVEVGGAGHARLVDQDHVPRPDPRRHRNRQLPILVRVLSRRRTGSVAGRVLVAG